MRRSEQESRVGEILGGRYELRELIEEGVVSDTYRATDKRERMPVVVTLLRPEFALQSGVVQRFTHAGKLLAALQHPNVAQVTAIESDEIGIPFAVEHVTEGEALAQALRAFANGMPFGAALNIMTPVIDALAALHVRGLAHGQLRAEHVVLVKAAGASQPRLIRFAALAARAAPTDTHTRIAPELRAGKASGDARSDVWALGALWHQALCGAPPLDGTTLLRERGLSVPEEFVALIERCLARDPQRRPAHADEVRMALNAARERWRSGRPPQRMSSAPPVAAPVAPSTPKAAAPKPAASRAAAPVAEAKPPAELAFALGATMFQQAAPRASSPSPSPSPKPSWSPAAPDDASHTVAARPRAAKPPPLPAEPVVDIKTMSDLAAAFGPMEGAENIVQSESADAARAREFRREMDAASAVEEQARKKTRKRDDAAGRPSSEALAEAARMAPATPLLSRKQLREGNAPQRQLSQEEMRAVRERIMAPGPSRWRAFGDGLLLVFALFLLFIMPLLCDASHVRARVQFGASAPIVLSAFVALTLVTFVRTWSVNVQLRPTLLGPTTIALQVVTLCVTALSASHFLPFGALGPVEYAARVAMPWAAGGFYLFMGGYGMMRAVRDGANNIAYGALIAMLYSGGFYASYRSVAFGLLNNRGRDGGVMAMSADGSFKSVALLRRVATGEGLGADAGTAEEQEQEQVQERHEVGASESDDMQAVDQLQKSKRGNQPKLQEIQKRIEEVRK